VFPSKPSEPFTGCLKSVLGAVRDRLREVVPRAKDVVLGLDGMFDFPVDAHILFFCDFFREAKDVEFLVQRKIGPPKN